MGNQFGWIPYCPVVRHGSARLVVVSLLLAAVVLGGLAGLVLVDGDTPHVAGDELAEESVEGADEADARPPDEVLPRVPRRQRERIGRTNEAAAEQAAASKEPEPPPTTRWDDLIVPKEGRRKLPAGVLEVAGDVRIEGGLDARDTVLILDGADQSLSGTGEFKGVVMRGGTKRLRGKFTTLSRDNATAGQAQLRVEPGTTFVVEDGGHWTTPNPYGFRIEGDVVVEGGVFQVSFSNGNGGDRGERSWAEGSSLTVLRGKFIGRGDADFRGATVTIHDGEIAIDDDLWHTGEHLTVYGGVVRNSQYGGAFHIGGSVDLRGGELRAYQRHDRGLRIGRESTLLSSGGKIAILGKPAKQAKSGIYLEQPLTLHELDIQTSTRFHADCPPEAAVYVLDRLSIAKGARFDARGHVVSTTFVATEETGELLR